MRIFFECETNCDLPYINEAILRTKDGCEVIIDRDHTEFTYDEDAGKMWMEWRDIYIWDGNMPNYNVPENLFSDGTYIECLEVEDDAPEDYEFRLLSASFNGTVIPILHVGE